MLASNSVPTCSCSPAIWYYIVCIPAGPSVTVANQLFSVYLLARDMTVPSPSKLHVVKQFSTQGLNQRDALQVVGHVDP